MADNKNDVTIHANVKVNATGIEKTEKAIEKLSSEGVVVPVEYKIVKEPQSSASSRSKPRYVYYDTETTGVSEKDVPVTFSAYKRGKLNKVTGNYDPEIDVLLDYGSQYKDRAKRWEVNKKLLERAMNAGLNDQGEGEIIDSALELRKRFGTAITGKIDFNKMEAALEERIKTEFFSNSVTPKELMRRLSLMTRDTTQMAGFNNIGFDTGMLRKFFSSGKAEDIPKLMKDFDRVFSGQIDIRDQFFKAMGEDLKTGKSQYVGKTFRLQDIVSFLRGSSSSHAHDASSDVMDTKFLYESL